MFQAQASANQKPTKFQINTKFLRKPRNKLLKMLPTAAALAPGAATTEFKQQEEQLQQPQMFNDDSNAKFKDFSIDSLLNK
nr:FI20819p1 [Drosophila melanogaster]